MRDMTRNKRPYVAPTAAPIYPRDSVHGRARYQPVAWLCADGHRHNTSQECTHV